MRRLFHFGIFAVILFALLSVSTLSTYATTNISTKKIDTYLDEQMKKNNIPGLSVAITHHGRVIYHKGFGTAGKDRPVTTETPFAIASLSKAFTAMAIMQLVESKKITLDTPVEKILPTFRVNDSRSSKITVRHLLNQTSGLADTVNPDINAQPQPKSLTDVVKRTQTVELEATPGQKHNYHNPNYEILARIVEVVSHETFPDYLQKHIFQPLEMNQTTHVTNIRDFQTANQNISLGHSLFFGLPLTSKKFDWFATGSHGIISTANDLTKWMAVQQNNGLYKGKQLVSSQGIKTMHTATSSTINYGMGWQISKNDYGEKEVFHSGTLAEFKSEMVLLPDQGFGIVLLSNAGVNEFIDYYGITHGIVDILMGREPNVSWMNNQNLSLVFLLLVLITILLTIRSLRRLKKWEIKLAKQPVWWIILKLLIRLIPLCLLLSVQQIYPLIVGGREMSLEGIVIIAPCIVTFMSTVAICNLMIVMIRLLYWRKKQNHSASITVK